jgi:hypothetical protein
MPRSDHAPWEPMLPLEPRTLLSAVSWDGGGDGTHWSDPLNWSNDALPTAFDDVLIDHTGTVVVYDLPGATTVSSLACVNSLNLASGQLGANHRWRQIGSLQMLGGDVAGPANLEVVFQLAWHAGRMLPGATTQILPGATLTLDRTSTRLERTIVNDGQLNQWDSSLSLAPGSSILNLAGHTWDILGGSAISRDPGDTSARVYNGGTVTVASDGFRVLTFSIPIYATNPGATLHLARSFSTPFSVTLSDQPHFGSAVIDGGMTLTMSGHVVVGASISGPGTLAATGLFSGPVNVGRLVVGPGTLALLEDSTVIDLEVLPGGVLEGPADVTVSGSFRWHAGSAFGVVDAGALGGTGELILLSSATLTPVTTFAQTYLLLGRTLRNFGRINWTAASFAVLTSGQIINEASGTIDGSVVQIADRRIIPAFYQPGTLPIINRGLMTFRGTDARITMPISTQGAGARLTVLDNSRLILTGTPSLLGDIDLGAGAELDVGDPLLSGGSLTTLAGTSISGAGTLRVTSSADLAGSVAMTGTVFSGGIVHFRATSTVGALTVDGGLIDGAGDVTVTGALHWFSGVINGPGQLVVASALIMPLFNSTTVTLARDLRTDGDLIFREGVTLQLPGTLTTGPSGQVIVGRTATVSIVSTGTLAITHLLTIFGTLTLAPTLHLDNTGIVQVHGTANINAQVAQISGTTLSGRWRIVDMPGFSDVPSLRFTQGLVFTDIAGTVGFAGMAAGALSPAFSGLSSISGTLKVVDGAGLALTPAGGTLTNSGTLALKLGSFSINGNFTQAPGATLIIASQSAAATGHLGVSGTATLDGALVLETRGTPSYLPNTPIQFLSATHIAGQFATLDTSGLTGIPAGTAPQLDYHPNFVRFQFV